MAAIHALDATMPRAPGVEEASAAYRNTLPPLPINPETRALAERIIWFEPPEKALSNTVRFITYAVAHAFMEEMTILRRYVSDDDFRTALDNAPPGLVDLQSWTYWQAVMGRSPPPPLPVRRFGDMVGPTTYGKTAASLNVFLGGE